MIPIAKPLIDEAEKQNVLEVLDSGMIASGDYVREFENRFATYIGSKYAAATSSGTTALHVALKAAGIKEGDKVLTTPFTFVASSNSILYCEGEPVFTDVKEDSFNIDPVQIRKKLEENPDIKALLIVHLFGLSCDMDAIMELVKEYNLTLIEDCAQAHGAEYNGKKVGSFGDVSVFSFYPTKNMTTSEGGIVVTDSSEIIDKAKMLIDHGSSKRYEHKILGYNYRMTNLAGAIGLKQLDKLDDFNHKRIENAKYFTDKLNDTKGIELPLYPDNKKHVFNLYTLKIENRDEFASYLEENGIGYGIHYPAPIYKQSLYQDLGFGNLQFPVTEKLCKQVISIPVHPGLSIEDREKIVKTIKDYSF